MNAKLHTAYRDLCRSKDRLTYLEGKRARREPLTPGQEREYATLKDRERKESMRCDHCGLLQGHYRWCRNYK